MNGKVYLVGAGPGDAGLITVRGQHCISECDVLVYDALANPVLLDLAPSSAERIYVGKRAADHTLTQDQINDLLAEKAQLGLNVVRLKGGDPYLFGRGAEEVAYLAERGVCCEVIPGVTSGIAAPAMAGIPVTHRKIASTVSFITGHEDPTKESTKVDYRALAQLAIAGGTLCFYMGVGRLENICQSLAQHGLPNDTPVALVQWGTTTRQRHVRTTLATARQDVDAAGISSPAIIVVGQVAGVEEPGLDFFIQRPLFDRRIVITRTRQQASQLKHSLSELGAQVYEAPTIALVEPDDWSDVDAAIRSVTDFDWLVLTSSNGVAALAGRLQALELDSRHLNGVQIAAIGTATADALREHLSIRADLIPTRFVAESLAAELIAKQDIAGKRFLLLRADIARPALPRLLKEAGADITELCAYQTKLEAGLPEDVLTALRDGEVNWITFTSSSTARNMMELLGDESHLLGSIKIASIGPITSETVRELGLSVTVEAQRSDIPGLIQAIVSAVRADASA